MTHTHTHPRAHTRGERGGQKQVKPIANFDLQMIQNYPSLVNKRSYGRAD